jgi:hypothetical protein
LAGQARPDSVSRYLSQKGFCFVFSPAVMDDGTRPRSARIVTRVRPMPPVAPVTKIDLPSSGSSSSPYPSHLRVRRFRPSNFRFNSFQRSTCSERAAGAKSARLDKHDLSNVSSVMDATVAQKSRPALALPPKDALSPGRFCGIDCTGAGCHGRCRAWKRPAGSLRLRRFVRPSAKWQRHAQRQRTERPAGPNPRGSSPVAGSENGAAHAGYSHSAAQY